MRAVIAQIIGFAGAAALILSFQNKKNARLFLLQAIGSALFALNFLLLGAYTGMVMNLINLLRGVLLVYGKRYANRVTCVLFCVVYLTAGILTYAGWASALVTVAQIATTLAMWSQNGKVIRLVNAGISSPAWLCNNIVVFSLGGILTESFGILSVLISFLRYGWNGFEKE